MITVKMFADRCGVSRARVRQWIKENRIKGAEKLGRDWMIPSDAGKPELLRTWFGTKAQRLTSSAPQEPQQPPTEMQPR